MNIRAVMGGLWPLLLCAASCGEEGAPGEIAVYVAGTGGRPAVSPLAVRIEATGNHAPCGNCGSLAAVVSGGAPPYTYQWSDPVLVGPGPHRVCPRENVRYAVIVTDASGSLAGASPANALGTADLDCTPAAADAGVGGGLNGCIVIPKREPTRCTSDDVPDDSNTSRIDFVVEPGRTYQYTYTQTLPIGIGVPSTVDVYLGMNPCERTQKIFTLQLDSTMTQSYCFTPAQSYRYSTNVVHVNGIPLTFGVTPTICDFCPSP